MKAWTKVPAGDINAANQRLWVAIGDNAEEVATRINTDPAFVANIARLMVNGGYEPSTSQKFARKIMGKNFFGIEEAIRIYGYPGQAVLEKLIEIRTPKGRLITEEEMRECKDTHVLVAGFPLSILDIRGIARQSDPTLFYTQNWYVKEAFAKDKGEVGWQLVRKEPIANSTSKNWNEPQALLSKDEETPTARIVVYTTIGHFLASGERLFENTYVCCLDLGSGGYRVDVGYFGAKGLSINRWYGDSRFDRIGLSAARKQ